jgi:hypothetical protein
MRDHIRSLSPAGAASVTFVHINRRRGLEHRPTMLSHTVRLVTAAAPILFLAFGELAAVPDTSVKIMATGLAAGIILDATVVRALLTPAVVSLMGHGYPPGSITSRPRPSPPARDARRPFLGNSTEGCIGRVPDAVGRGGQRSIQRRPFGELLV